MTHIFCSDAPITCLPFNLVRNSVVQLPSSVIRDLRYAQRIKLLQLLLLILISARYAIATLAIKLIGRVDVDEKAVFTADSV